ncbi:MAG: hypothetical protein EA404_12320 [Spirochaetaceae bacterium]|nr:MAG: hypothetical protein EA404_12320 [Spirochaetaceae bacterium]
MEIQDTLAPECCTSKLVARSKDEALNALAALAARSPACAGIPQQTIYGVLARRESQGTTGFGNEVALPHARLEGLTRFVVFVAVAPRGVAFDALDKKKVRLFFVILGPPEQVNQHLRTLATISRLVAHTGLKRELISARSVEAMIESLVRNIGEPLPAGQGQQREVMKLMLISLYVEEHLHEILEVLVELGVEGASILDATGMGRYISNVPIFAEFIGFMQERKNFAKTILALVPERHVHKIVESIESVTGDLDTREGAAIVVLDISLYKGTMKMM